MPRLSTILLGLTITLTVLGFAVPLAAQGPQLIVPSLEPDSPAAREPAGDVEEPAGGQIAPADDEDAPADDEDAPADDEDAPADDEKPDDAEADAPKLSEPAPLPGKTAEGDDPEGGPALLPVAPDDADALEPAADDASDEIPSEKPDEEKAPGTLPGVEGPMRLEVPPADEPAATPETTPGEAEQKPEEEPAGEAIVPAPKNAPDASEPTLPAVKPLPPLSPALTALRDRVRRTLAGFYRQSFSTRGNTPSDILYFCLPYGCQTEVLHGTGAGARLNGITCLCWNYPCAGFELLKISHGHVAPRVGYGLQAKPSQFLATLALSRVPGDYPVRVGQQVGTVGDIVAFEQATCQSGTEMSLKLVGLAYYVPPDATWKNTTGEEWSLERMVGEELAQPIVTASGGGTFRLLGLAYAVARRAESGLPVEGQYARARKFLDEFESYALSLQNGDGSWHPYIFAVRGSSKDLMGNLRSTGLVASWLTVSLSDEEVESARMIRAIDFLNTHLSGRRWETASMAPRDIATMMHALHALALYDARVFKPRDPAPEETAPAGEAPAEKPQRTAEWRGMMLGG